VKEKLEKENVAEIIALSPIQMGMLFHYLKEADNNLYNVQLSLLIEGELDVNALEQAFAQVQLKNDALRSVFRWEEVDKPVQIILKTCPYEFAVVDASGNADQLVQEYLLNDQHKRFDLSKLPLRLSVIKIAEGKYIFNITHHHILYDGWSTGILLGELFQCYNKLRNGQDHGLPVKHSYKQVRLAIQKRSKPADAEKYWKQYLNGYEQVFLSSGAAHAGQQIKKLRTATAHRPVEAFAKEHKVTKAAVIYSAYGILLQKYSNVQDVVFGTTISSRDAAVKDHDRVMGNFINTIPLRLMDMDALSLVQAVTSVNNDLAARNDFHSTPYSDIKQYVHLKPTDDLFDSVVVVENYPLDEELINSSNEIKVKLNAVYENTGIPVLVTVFFKEDVEIEIAYDESITGAFAKSLADNFVAIIEEICAHSNKKVSAVSLQLNKHELELLEKVNDTAADYPANKTIVDLFEEQVNKTPGNIALQYGSGSLTYKELSAKADKIAGYLRTHSGVRTGDLVGIMLERDEYIIPAIFGILKAGAAYVPIDPHYPLDRIHSIVEDAKLKVLITRSRFADAAINCTVIDLDKSSAAIAAHAPDLSSLQLTGNDAAYVIYTSGSTGKPKGVMIQHHAVINRILWMQQEYPITSADVLLQKTPVVFDVSVWELFWWSFTGASLYLLKPGGEKEPREIIDAIRNYKVTTIHFVPSMLNAFLLAIGDDFNFADLASLRQVFASGEALKGEHANLFKELLHRNCGAALINLYGPTEATVDVSHYKCSFENESAQISIGKPINNIRLHILNRYLHKVPVGVPGELHIAGVGLAKGYVGNEKLTNEKFIAAPQLGEERVYKTGDLVKWMPDGNIAFLGRIDEQVKIRGYRIEPAEITSVLRTYEGVQEAAVLARERAGEKYLVAYVSGHFERPDTYAADLREFLSKKLPAYMVPSFYVQVDVMPVNSNGKLDRKALPEPQFEDNNAIFVAASGEVEEQLVKIWSAILGYDNISTHINFFDAGGDSIKLISIASKIKRTFNKDVSVADLFDYPTIAELSRFITKEDEPQEQEFRKEQTNVNATPVDIAIIGMSCRFPGANNVDAFWNNLRGGKESITREDQPGDAALVSAKGMLEGYELFDASFFGYLPTEAGTMDPQMRIFHECVWEGIEHAGYNPSGYEGRIGLYGGASPNPYYNIEAGEEGEDMFEKWAALSYADKDFICQRVSYKLNLKGPSVSLSTACSTSLVAVDMACNDLLNGKCDIAVAGGVSVTLHDNKGYRYHKGMILSADGRCRAFDESAGGTVGGNGAGVVVLKKLEDAIKDGDEIHGVIKGTAINNDGSEKVGFTAPGIEGQSRVIAGALAGAGIDAESISYVEAHGTGTALGDPVEIAGLSRAFSTNKKQYCAIGSVKTNIGHLDAAAGIAGLIKTVLCLKHKQLVPSLHYTKANANIDFANSPFYVNVELKEWKNDKYPRRAGVSSFGIGGTNAHVIVQEAPVLQEVPPATGDYQLLLLSGRTTTALQANRNNLVEYLRQNENVKLSDIAYTLQTGRAHFEYRQAVVCKDHAEAIERLYTPAIANEPAEAAHLQSLAESWLKGADINWNELHGAEKRKRVPLPSYAFERTKFPIVLEGAAGAKEASGDLVRSSNISGWFYAPAWKMCSLVNDNEASIAGNNLIFSDENGLGSALQKQFVQHGRQVVCVKEDAEDINTLFAQLASHNQLPDRIIYSGSSGLYNLLNIVKVANAYRCLAGRQLVLLTSDCYNITGKENIVPAKAMASALLKVISQEYPEVSISHIDVPADALTGSLANKLYHEVIHRYTGKVVALRGNKRWEQVFENIRVQPSATSTAILRPQGVYLITGGLGDVGFAFAQYLFKKVNAKLILLGRAPLNDRIERFRQLEADGCEVIYFACDIANKDEVTAALAKAEQQFGYINGIIHAAGIVNGDSYKPVSELDVKDLECHFRSKVHGLNVLMELMEERKPEFCILTSSISTILGGLGFAAYASANAYMDAVVNARKEKELPNWVSVNFDGLNLNGKGGQGISSSEIDDVFEHVLNMTSLPQVIVSVGNLDKRLRKWIYRDAATQKVNKANRSSIAGQALVTYQLFENSGEQLIDPAQHALIKLWQEFFGLDRITPDDNFFEIGGDSLKALVMVGRIHKEFNVEITVSELFAHATVRELSAHMRTLLSAAQRHVTIPRAVNAASYPLSSIQRRFYFLHAFDKSSVAYNMPLQLMLEGRVDEQQLLSAFKKLIERHEAIRTSFVFVNDEPRQRILDEVEFELEKYTAYGNENEIIQRFIRPFDLEAAPLMRAGIIHLSAEKHILMVDMHHIITDAVSRNVLIKDFMSLYNNETLQPLALHYKDYAVWQQSEEHQAEIASKKHFWLKEFATGVAPLELPADFPRPLINTYAGRSVEFEIDEERTGKLRSIAEAEGVTMFMLLLSVYNVLLSKLSGQEDIVTGIAVSGRHHTDLEQVMGMFVNTLPVRSYPAGNLSFKEFMSLVKAKVLTCFDHQLYPYEDLINELNLERSTSRNPLFDTEFAFENFERSTVELPELVIKPYHHYQPISKFDLTLIASEKEERIHFIVEYSTDLFRDSTIKRFIACFDEIVNAVVSDRNRKLSAIAIIPAEEKALIMNVFNNTSVPFPQNKTFVDLFEEQVKKTPASVATVHNLQSLSYAELNGKANQLANYLNVHTEQGSCVPVLMNPSVDLLICMLGIFKAGMVYVPINIDAPLARIIDNIADLDAKLLITKSDHIADAISFCDKLAGETKVDNIVLFDNNDAHVKSSAIFKACKLAQQLKNEEVFCAVQDADVNERTAQLTKFLSEKNLTGNTGLLLLNPVLRIVAMQSLRLLNVPFRLLDPEQELSKQIEGIACIITENSLNDKTDTLLWETSGLQTIVLLDNYETLNKKEDALRKIWNHVAEQTTEALNDYGWSNSYTGERFSLAEMGEYVNNFKEKLSPYLNQQSRVLEVGCGHGIVLFEMAPKVGYYHATDPAENILHKNKQRLEREGIYNVVLEAYGASDIKNVNEKNFDAVICSSVVHYFPDTIYLENFIQQAIDLLGDEGIIYLDDLMDLRKKQQLMQSTNEYKLAHPQARVKTDWSNDLFVGPGFFDFLQEKFPAIIEVASSAKTGVIANELTKYRYDVLIRINKSAATRSNSKQAKKRYTNEDIGVAVGEPLPQGKHISFATTAGIKELALLAAKDLPARSKPDDVAYIIYTSGTTGKPKGAMIHHAGMLNHLFAKINDLSITAEDVVAETAPPFFDISIWQFLCGLLTGACTYIIDKEKQLEPLKLSEELHKGTVTIFESVPSLITSFLDGIANKQHQLQHVRWMLATGEPLSISLTEKWYSFFPGIQLVNAYGPTEASDDITHCMVQPAHAKQVAIPIGKPVQNMQIYILDNYLNMCPIGVKGEICVAGTGVGKGYWRNDAQTHKVFIPNPHAPQQQGYDVIYKTGDIGYYTADGNIICTGRKDEQVKIRGHRIELGEIEHRLSQHASINEAVVITKGSEHDKYLVAYYVAGSEIASDELKSYLAGKLPEYMVPAWYVRLQRIPVTANGKLNKKALPEPGITADDNYVPPSNDIQERLVEIWSQLLKVDKGHISVNRSFFELGGHSLKATMLANQIHKYFQIEVPIKEIFRKPDVESLADYLITVEQMKSTNESVEDSIEIAI
jgi:amino acid adenylation domain-containing protein